MRHKLGEHIHLYVRSMGKLLEVTAAFDNDDEANRHMAKTNDAVVAVTTGGLILLADKGDKGVRVSAFTGLAT